MAGSFIEVKATGLGEISKRLNQLMKKAGNIEPALQLIGDDLIESTQKRFEEMVGPDGQAWEPLSEVTLERKQRKDRILTEHGTLSGTINKQIIDNTLYVGSNQKYAAMHQFGGTTSPFSMFPNQDIPARPFLGLPQFEREHILDVLNDYLEN